MQLKRNKEVEFEILKKNHKKQIIIGALAVCVIGGALTFTTSKAKYKLTQDMSLIKGSVNYKVPDMRIVALYTENDSGDYTETNNIPTSGYALNQEKSMCKVYDGTTSIENAPKDNNVTIEYKNGGVNFLNLKKKNTRCYLYFDKQVGQTISSIIASLNAKTTTPTFNTIAATDEGVYAVSDGMYGGTSYYWRGAVTNNYVKFANFCWRIIRINGDGSMRLIYDGNKCHSNGTDTTESVINSVTSYNNQNNQSNYVGWTYEGQLQRPVADTTSTDSKAKVDLENWYNANITGTNARKVAEGKYCNDRNVRSGDTWTINDRNAIFYYAAYKRVYTDYAPTLSCATGDIYTVNIGLITVDEVMYAGGTRDDNTSYYLRNGNNYWTMSPFRWADNNARIFIIKTSGSFDMAYVNGACYFRPVINLRSDVTFKSGTDGSQSNPYEVV